MIGKVHRTDKGRVVSRGQVALFLIVIFHSEGEIVTEGGTGSVGHTERDKAAEDIVPIVVAQQRLLLHLELESVCIGSNDKGELGMKTQLVEAVKRRSKVRPKLTSTKSMGTIVPEQSKCGAKCVCIANELLEKGFSEALSWRAKEMPSKEFL